MNLQGQQQGDHATTDQFFHHRTADNSVAQQQPPNGGIGINNYQMFSPQLSQARIIGQPSNMQPAVQNANIANSLMSNIKNNQSLNNGIIGHNTTANLGNSSIVPNSNSSLQEPLNTYLLRQKMDSLMSQGPRPHGGPQTLQNQQNMSINKNMDSVIPPGLNMVQQQAQSVPAQQHSQQVQPHSSMLMNLPPNLPISKHINLVNNSLTPLLLPAPNHLFIRDVWNTNLHNEFSVIRQYLTQYNLVSLNVEFVGTMARPIGNFRSKSDYHYQTMRSNIDLLRCMKLGLSISDTNGNKPENGPSTWQFNFKYEADKEMLSAESLEVLRNGGFNFEMSKVHGVDAFEFAHLMMDSGLLMEPNITWITYHGIYDLGFLTNLLINNLMPNNKEDFEWWVHKFLPNVYDLNILEKSVKELKNPKSQNKQAPTLQPDSDSLNELGEELGIPRFNIFGSAAGQSLLALLSYCQLSKICLHKLPNGNDFTQFNGVLYGIDLE